MDPLRPSEYHSQKMLPKRKIAMQVLVVEGNSGISQVLSAFLKRDGHIVDEAYDGRDAIRQLQRGQYDIVITDSEIISVDGPELCKFISSHFRDIYVIGISGYLSALKDLKDAGADICFSKPFDINYPKRAIDCIMSLRGPSA
jgi:CheY-like chemotaxis protein